MKHLIVDIKNYFTKLYLKLKMLGGFFHINNSICKIKN